MDKVYEMAVIELVRLLRIVKRQLLLLRGVPMNQEERRKLLKAIEAVEAEFEVFRL
ncbi:MULTISPECIES: hypothetical protein [Clostridia]|uniref:hypothetical protein n=1 Tax=Clostridia TaxID=186801 RepID=UPI00136428CD|nr:MULTISPECIES: hypothetical protein [Eubacteriales]